MIIYDVYNIIIGFISFLYMIKHVYIYGDSFFELQDRTNFI
jgi:hypothetical protein